VGAAQAEVVGAAHAEGAADAAHAEVEPFVAQAPAVVSAAT
jgi:hypothetical protein